MICFHAPTSNETAYRQMRDSIDRRYPRGHYVAIDDGRIAADASTFEELDSILIAAGYSSPDILVVQAGIDTPDFAWILLQGGAQ
jgi:hypothetical protein